MSPADGAATRQVEREAEWRQAEREAEEWAAEVRAAMGANGLKAAVTWDGLVGIVEPIMARTKTLTAAHNAAAARAHRVPELERRLAELERRLAASPPAAGKAMGLPPPARVSGGRAGG